MPTDVPVNERAPPTVRMVMGTEPCADPGRDSVTARLAKSHDSASALPPKRATERLPSLPHVQVPGVCGWSRQSLVCGLGGGDSGAVVVVGGGGGVVRGGCGLRGGCVVCVGGGVDVGACVGGADGGIAVHDASAAAPVSARNFIEW